MTHVGSEAPVGDGQLPVPAEAEAGTEVSAAAGNGHVESASQTQARNAERTARQAEAKRIDTLNQGRNRRSI